VKQWILDFWNDPAKFIAAIRTLVAIAGVVIPHLAGLPEWVSALGPAIALAMNAGDKNEFQPTTKLPAVDTVIVPGHEVPIK